jgi:hypothetical protein
MYDDNSVSAADVVKYLFGANKDQHALRVLRLIEQLKVMEGELQAYYYQRDNPSTLTTK